MRIDRRRDLVKLLRQKIVWATVSVILAVLIVYWRDLVILTNEALRSESVGHVIYVPFFVAYMLYLKRHLVRASLSLTRVRSSRELIFVSLDELVGLALVVSAFLLYWYGSYTFYPVEYHLASLPILVSGVILIIFNRKTLIYIVFPILFLLFLVPIPATVTYAAGASLANFNTQVSYTLLNVAGLPVNLTYAFGAPRLGVNDLSGQSMNFTIDPACSGIYSLTAFAMFATFLAYILRGSILKKVALFTLGFSTLVVLSIFRISFLVFIGHRLGEETAMTFFHTVTGSVFILIGMLITLFMAEKLLSLKLFTGSVKAQQCVECSDSTDSSQFFCMNCGRFLNNCRVKLSKREMVKIAGLVLGSWLVTLSINAPIFAFAQGSAIRNSNWETSTEIFPPIAGYHNVTFRFRDTAYEQLSRQDASLYYAYYPEHTRTHVDPLMPLQVTFDIVETQINPGDSVTLSATPSGGYTPYTIGFYQNGTDEPIYRVDSVGENQQVNYTTSLNTLGTFYFYTVATDSQSNHQTSVIDQVDVVQAGFNVVFTVDQTRIELGDPVTMHATPSQGVAPYTVTFSVVAAPIESFPNIAERERKSFSWTPPQAGSMDFWVRVTDSSGEVINSQSEVVDVTETPPGGVFSAFSNASSQTFNHTVYIDVGVASSISNLHNWEGCYVSWQTIRGKPPLVPVLDSREIVLLEDPLIIARYFVFVDPKNITQVTLYWFEEALFNTGTTVQRKYVRISLIIRTTDQSNIRQQEDQLLAIGNSIATYWGPLKQQSLITIGIPILQYLLVGFIGMTITIGVIQHTTNQRVKQNNLKVFDSFATNREKLVLQTIRMFKRDTPPPESMLKSIQNTINETAKDDISSEKLRDILNNLETHNLIRKAIVTIQNQPWLVWKF